MDSSSTSLSPLLADTLCWSAGLLLRSATLLLSQDMSKYSWMNLSKAAISSRAPRLISALAEAELESELRLLELEDFLEEAVDMLPWEESVELEPRDRELAWGRVG